MIAIKLGKTEPQQRVRPRMPRIIETTASVLLCPAAGGGGGTGSGADGSTCAGGAAAAGAAGATAGGGSGNGCIFVGGSSSKLDKLDDGFGTSNGEGGGGAISLKFGALLKCGDAISGSEN